MSWRDGGAGPRRTDGGGSRRPAEPTVLLSAHDARLSRTVPADLVCDRSRSGDGVVVVTTRDAPSAVAARLDERVDALEPESLAVVSAVEPSGDAAAATTVRSVGRDPAPSELTTAVEAAYGDLAADRVHLLVDALSAPQDGAVEPVYRRAQEVAMTVGAESGLGLFAVDARRLSPAFVERLTHLVDVHVCLREDDGEPEACWTSLTGTSDGWHPWSDVEFAQVGQV